MKITIHFNFPNGQKLAYTEMTYSNIEDAQREYRIGVIHKENPNEIYWHNSGWAILKNTNTDTIAFSAKHDDKIIVESKKIGTERTEGGSELDIETEWPKNAFGPTTTVRTWNY